MSKRAKLYQLIRVEIGESGKKQKNQTTPNHIKSHQKYYACITKDNKMILC